MQTHSDFDASDQASLSRVYGGIHPAADDFSGRRIGHIVGPDAWNFARTLWGVPEPASLLTLVVGAAIMLVGRWRRR